MHFLFAREGQDARPTLPFNLAPPVTLFILSLCRASRHALEESDKRRGKGKSLPGGRTLSVCSQGCGPSWSAALFICLWGFCFCFFTEQYPSLSIWSVLPRKCGHAINLSLQGPRDQWGEEASDAEACSFPSARLSARGRKLSARIRQVRNSYGMLRDNAQLP